MVKVFDETMNSVSAGSRSRDGLREVGAVDVGDEAERHVALAVVRSASYAITGPRSEPPMPMLMTLRMRLPVCPFHSPLRTRLAKSGHLVEDGVDLGHHVLAVDDDRRTSRRAQRDVQDRSLLRDVDLLAAEHRVDPRPQAGFLRKLHETDRSVSSVMRFFE